MFCILTCLPVVQHPEVRGASHLYVHIASPAEFQTSAIAYQDYELDVVLKPGKLPEIRDQDEFAAAALRFGYSPEFQQRCWATVDEAQRLVEKWTWSDINQ